MFADETSNIVQRKVAYSRVHEDYKVYVQNAVEKNAAKIYDLIANHQAHFYICGKVWFVYRLISFVQDFPFQYGLLTK